MSAPSHSNASPMDEVQVVINSYGRDASFIERAARSVLGQRHRPTRVHFVDQNPLPLTLAQNLMANPAFSHHHRPDRVGARARNTALELVHSGWIAFADDDSAWLDDYSVHLLDLLSTHPELDLIAGPLVDEETGMPYTLRHVMGGNLGGFFGSKLLYGANFLVRAETFRRVGGYDTRLGPGTGWPSSEEADLCWRIISAGARCHFDPRLKVTHPPMHAADTAQAARKGYSYGIGKGALAALWIIEKRHRYGFLEFFEMSLVPLLKITTGLLRADTRAARIHFAIFRGRQRGFWSNAWSLLRHA